MDKHEIIEKWLHSFGKNVNKKDVENHVTSHGNHLWHLFTWCEIPCLEGDDARNAFDNLQYSEAISFCDGYSNRIKDIKNIGKISSADVDVYRASDVYIVACDFSWTYVRTHEPDLGPYFCIHK